MLLVQQRRWKNNNNTGATWGPINPSTPLEQHIKPAAQILTYSHQHFAHCTQASKSLKTTAPPKNSVSSITQQGEIAYACAGCITWFQPACPGCKKEKCFFAATICCLTFSRRCTSVVLNVQTSSFFSKYNICICSSSKCCVVDIHCTQQRT